MRDGHLYMPARIVLPLQIPDMRAGKSFIIPADLDIVAKGIRNRPPTRKRESGQSLHGIEKPGMRHVPSHPDSQPSVCSYKADWSMDTMKRGIYQVKLC